MKKNINNKIKNNRGFSLIELMVVVAIIGVLASFAIPQYQTFQSKARQKEASMMLSAYFTSAQASLVELGAYPGNFVSMGFAPAGRVHYRITAKDNSTALPLGGVEEAACVDTSQTCVATIASFKTWSEDSTTASFKVIAANGTPTVADTTFLTFASSVIKPGGTIDEWSVNQAKTFSNTKVGL